MDPVLHSFAPLSIQCWDSSKMFKENVFLVRDRWLTHVWLWLKCFNVMEIKNKEIVNFKQKFNWSDPQVFKMSSSGKRFSRGLLTKVTVSMIQKTKIVLVSSNIQSSETLKTKNNFMPSEIKSYGKVTVKQNEYRTKTLTKVNTVIIPIQIPIL